MKRSSQLAPHIFERPFGTGFRAGHGLILFSSRRVENEYELRENEGC